MNQSNRKNWMKLRNEIFYRSEMSRTLPTYKAQIFCLTLKNKVFTIRILPRCIYYECFKCAARKSKKTRFYCWKFIKSKYQSVLPGQCKLHWNQCNFAPFSANFLISVFSVIFRVFSNWNQCKQCNSIIKLTYKLLHVYSQSYIYEYFCCLVHGMLIGANGKKRVILFMLKM